MARFRALKGGMRDALAADDWETRLEEFVDLPERQVTGPLLSLRLDRDESVRWRAAVALGRVVARMAESSMESARVLMRTLMWYLNEESGNLGWGIPEAMAEAMANNAGLAREYHTILASYIYCESDCDGNFLDHPELRRGVFWGLGRLASARPELVRKAERFLVAALNETDGPNRGLAAWTLGLLGADSAREGLLALESDPAEVRLFREGTLETTNVGQLAREALERIGPA
ncbi:DVU0298 family protein [Paucidesulfovibrio longus]|uniref:DVU0298 family protein n=1 Tax=Paucidesulfovibrio longus TaxID=889 RepID=UPI0003B651EB|nr:DVU0298 family protein [Paucidesulfovibrio longus]